MAEAVLARLLEWFLASGGGLHDSLGLQYSDDYGYSFITKTGIAQNGVVCKCPFSLTLSHLNCLASPPEGVKSCSDSTVCDKLIGRVKHNVVAAFFLAEQRLKGESSFWFPYIDALPKETNLTTPLYFEKDDLVWLHGTNLYTTTVPEAQTAVELRRSMYKEAWTSGIAVLEEHGVDTKPYTWELCLWAATMFSSRSFTSNIMTQKSDDTFPLLYPVIDIFNHKIKQQVFWNMDKGTFSLVLPKGTPAGEQVFNNYAPKGNEELLMGYGFCIPDNPCDQVVLRTAKPPPQIHEALKARLPNHFKSTEWSTDESGFYLRGINHYAGGYSNPFGLTCLRGIPTELVLTLQTMVSFGFQSSYEDEVHQRAELWWATLDALLMRLQHKLAAILQWDQKLPKDPANRCQAFAKIYRDGQIGILRDNIRDLEAVLNPLDEGTVDIMDVFGSIPA